MLNCIVLYYIVFIHCTAVLVPRVTCFSCATSSAKGKKMEKRYQTRNRISKNVGYVLSEKVGGKVEEIMREHRELIPGFDRLDANFHEFSIGSVNQVRYNTYF